MEFEIEDIVEYEGEFFMVTGVIHDDKRLFITKFDSNDEIEINFDAVTTTWEKKHTPRLTVKG